MSDDLAGDLMLGAEPIAEFLSQLFGRPVTTRHVYNWCQRRALPHSHLGHQLVGSKSKIRAHFNRPSPEPQRIADRRW